MLKGKLSLKLSKKGDTISVKALGRYTDTMSETSTVDVPSISFKSGKTVKLTYLICVVLIIFHENY